MPKFEINRLNTHNTLQLELHVPDFERTKRFYGLLGFEVVWERKPEGFKGYLILRNEVDCILNFWGGNEHIFDQPFFSRFSKKTTRGYGVEVVVTTSQNLEELSQRLVNAKYNVVEPLAQQPWGLDDFRVLDPDGYYLRVTSPHDILDTSNAVD